MNETATIEIVTERMPLTEFDAAQAERAAKRLGVPAADLEFVRKRLTADDLRVEPEERAIIARISTDAIDRDNEVLSPKGAMLVDYRKNPVVLWAHGHDNPPVGKALWIKKDERGVVAKIKFASRPESHEGAWLPDDLLHLYREGIMRAFSVGFIPVKAHAPTEKDIEARPDLAGVSRIYDKWSLLEFSAVPVPSNPEALTLAKAMDLGADTREALGIGEDKALPGGADMTDRVREFAGEQEGVPETPQAQDVDDSLLEPYEPDALAADTSLDEITKRLDTLISRLEIAMLEPEAPEDIEIEAPQDVIIELDAGALATRLKEAFDSVAATTRRLPQDCIDRARGVVEIDDEE